MFSTLCEMWSWLLCPRSDDGNMSLLGGYDDDDNQWEGSSDLAVYRLRFPLNLRWPSTRIASQKTAHDENTYSGLKAASFSEDDEELSLNQEDNESSEGGIMCLQGFPHNHTRDSMCPIIIRRIGSRQGAVQVLNTGFQRLQMFDEQRRQRRGNRTRFTHKQ